MLSCSNLESKVMVMRPLPERATLSKTEQAIWMAKGFDMIHPDDMTIDNFFEKTGFSRFWDLYETSEPYLLTLRYLGPRKRFLLKRYLKSFGLTLPEGFTARDRARTEHGGKTIRKFEGVWAESLIHGLREYEHITGRTVRMGDLKTFRLGQDLGKNLTADLFLALRKELAKLSLIPAFPHRVANAGIYAFVED